MNRPDRSKGLLQEHTLLNNPHVTHLRSDEQALGVVRSPLDIGNISDAWNWDRRYCEPSRHDSRMEPQSNPKHAEETKYSPGYLHLDGIEAGFAVFVTART